MPAAVMMLVCLHAFNQAPSIQPRPVARVARQPAMAASAREEALISSIEANVAAFSEKQRASTISSVRSEAAAQARVSTLLASTVVPLAAVGGGRAWLLSNRLARQLKQQAQDEVTATGEVVDGSRRTVLASTVCTALGVAVGSLLAPLAPTGQSEDGLASGREDGSPGALLGVDGTERGTEGRAASRRSSQAPAVAWAAAALSLAGGGVFLGGRGERAMRTAERTALQRRHAEERAATRAATRAEKAAEASAATAEREAMLASLRSELEESFAAERDHLRRNADLVRLSESATLQEEACE